MRAARVSMPVWVSFASGRETIAESHQRLAARLGVVAVHGDGEGRAWLHGFAIALETGHGSGAVEFQVEGPERAVGFPDAAFLLDDFDEVVGG